MPRLLLVTYFFPPLGGVGPQRALRFARYLPEHGWDVTVLAPENPSYPVRDSLETARDASYTVARTPNREFPNRPYRLRQWLVARAFPDERVGWARKARAVAEAEALSADVVMSSSPPVTAHLIARSAANSANKPWIADFRDPYTFNMSLDAASPMVDRHRALEREIISEAEAISVVSDGMREDFDEMGARRTEVLTNGFDPDEFVTAVPERLPGGFTLVHVGSLYGVQTAGPFLEALAMAVEEHPGLRDRLRVHFVGNVDAPQRALIESFVHPGMLSVHGFVTRQRALSLMRGADALLLLIPPGHSREVVTGKLFDYAASGRPVVALAGEGPAAGVVAQIPGGTVAHDVRDMAVVLGRLGASDRLPDEPVPAVLQGYSADALAGQLASLLDEVRSRHE